jgi:predicted nucleic acid-binding protein
VAQTTEFVLDTSVVLKWFVNEDEQNVREARAVREAYLHNVCSIRSPDFLLLELTNALKAGRKFSREEVGLILQSVRDLELRLEAVRWETLARAVDIASQHRVAIYDSYFLAAAIESDAVLVTADEAFLRRVGPHPNAVALRDLRMPTDLE